MSVINEYTYIYSSNIRVRGDAILGRGDHAWQGYFWLQRSCVARLFSATVIMRGEAIFGRGNLHFRPQDLVHIVEIPYIVEMLFSAMARSPV